ncbi:MAG: proteasome accessory factor PafA2 family protein [Acidimicrobiales bacterium]
MGESHESYLVRQPVQDDEVSRTLMPFLVSRVIYAGAGAVVANDEERQGIVLSARAATLARLEGAPGSSGDLPLLDRSATALAGEGEGWRVRVIGADANQSEVATYLKVGATALVLRLLEARRDLAPDLTLEDPLRAALQVNRDLGFRRPVRLASGRTASPIALQAELLAAVRRLLDVEGATSEERSVVRLWKRSLILLESEDDPGRSRVLDWAAKRELTEPLRSLDPAQAMELDGAYHDLGPEGPFSKLEQAGRMQRMCTDQEVTQARTLAPATTRARLRGDFVRRAKCSGP